MQTVKKTFQTNEQDKTQQIIQIKNQIAKNHERINNAQALMLDGDLSAEDYKEIKNRIQPEIEKSNRQITDVNSFETSYRTYMEDGVIILSNLAKAFSDADLYVKHQILGSIFPEKLIFENNSFRTNKLFESYARMLSICRQFQRKKNGPKQFFSFSPLR